MVDPERAETTTEEGNVAFIPFKHFKARMVRQAHEFNADLAENRKYNRGLFTKVSFKNAIERSKVISGGSNGFLTQAYNPGPVFTNMLNGLTHKKAKELEKLFCKSQPSTEQPPAGDQVED